MKPSKPVILTGVRASNSFIHIGNYFGLLCRLSTWRMSLGQSTTNLFIPDLHSFTTNWPQQVIRQHSEQRGLYRRWIAPLDNPSIHLTAKSHSAQRTIVDSGLLHWIGEMGPRMAQFKDKNRVSFLIVKCLKMNWTISKAWDTATHR